MVVQDQRSRAADSHLRRWGLEEPREKLTKRTRDVSRLPPSNTRKDGQLSVLMTIGREKN